MTEFLVTFYVREKSISRLADKLSISIMLKELHVNEIMVNGVTIDLESIRKANRRF